MGLKITADGRLTEDWKIVGCVVRDTGGNYREGLLRFRALDGATRFGLNYSLDTNTIWRVEAAVLRSTDHPEGETVKLQINSGQSRYITNSSGNIFVCAFDGNVFQVSGLTPSDDPTYVAARMANDEGGTPAMIRHTLITAGNRSKTSTWEIESSRPFFEGLNRDRPMRIAPSVGGVTVPMSDEQLRKLIREQSGRPVTSLKVQLVFPKVVKTEFFVKPDSGRASERPLPAE